MGYLFLNHVESTNDEIAKNNIRRLMKLWTNFAKTGNPNEENSEIQIEWKPTNSNQFNYLDIGNTLSTGIDPDKDRYEFWNDVYEKYA